VGYPQRRTRRTVRAGLNHCAPGHCALDQTGLLIGLEAISDPGEQPKTGKLARIAVSRTAHVEGGDLLVVIG